MRGVLVPMKGIHGRFRRSVLALLMCASMAAGCAVGPIRGREGAGRGGTTGGSLEHATALMKDGYLLEAMVELQKLVKSKPGSRDAGEAYLNIGRIYLKWGEYEQAADAFGNAVEGSSGDRDRAVSHAYQGICAYYLGRHDASIDLLREALGTHMLSDSLRARVRLTIGLNYERLGKPISGLIWTTKALQGSQGDVRAEAEARTKALLENSMSLADLEEAAFIFADAMPAQWVRLEIARRDVNLGRTERAKGILEEMAKNTKEPSIVAECGRLLRMIEGHEDVNPLAVGCILPLSGRYSRFGRRMLSAILAGADVFEEGGTDPVRLVIRDSGGDPETAVGAVDELVRGEKVIAIVGPLLQAVAEAVAARAEALNVPVMHLARKEGIASLGEWNFQNTMTDSMQVEGIAAYATQVMQFERFAILHPEDGYGVSLATMFGRAVEDRGGSVTAIASYSTEQTDFAGAIREIAGTEFWTRMAEEEVEWKETIDKISLEEEDMELDLLDVEQVNEESLQDILGFDAIFIPDSFKRVILIAPQLHFYEITDIPLLGTSRWNSPKLVEEAVRYLQNAIFVDSFFVDSRESSVQEFRRKFEACCDQDPGLLEAMAYDSIRLVIGRMGDSGSRTREALRSDLAALKNYPGALGTLSINDDGLVERDLFFLGIKGGAIVQLEGLEDLDPAEQ